MKLKTIYRSDVVNKDFDTVEELEAAEKEYEEKHAAETALKAERAKEAKEVEEAFKEANEAYKKANELLNAFIKKHKSFHYSITDAKNIPNVFDVLSDFWLF